ncbi:bifunctional NAD(P)/FAD-dependent oxidoreductase/class I SAM-dependent methyltransferase [Tomitella fengzijianii]|uniref:NAD(P)/FAD-dependent oxidoreductase n=1 Tax=Tomitella fengzijianii TaxID=2597660 RepID=A0A516WZ92_9ACTN|nr:bifunctional NAD(P)/FAD-dependent oxidoreductase/class I SAM-dependent methyltransferase [Tomitella fengzijianii]QDQ96115.1 NAD(P)/FAD-dependent oxidoreductase [Tomitella fengzijianii]
MTDTHDAEPTRNASSAHTHETLDAVVIGGGAAGLSGALALARSRRSVLVLDAGEPRNAVAAHVHNFLTRDGTPPAALYAAGREDLEGYGGSVVTARVTDLSRDGEDFLVTFDDGGTRTTVRARRLLAATGSHDELPDVPGLAEQWGSGVLHCPYCHGWEVRDQRIGVLATGPMAAHQALLFRQVSEHVTMIRHGAAPFGDAQSAQFAALGIPVVEGPVAAVESDSGALAGVQLADGSVLGLDALVVAPVTRARAGVLAPLGLEPRDFLAGDTLMGTVIDADPTGKTAVPGVYAAGNITDPSAQVIASASAGLMAGAAINADLAAADAADALYEYRYGQRAWDDRYSGSGGHEHGHSHAGHASDGRMWSGRPNAVVVDELSDLRPGSAFDAGAGEGGDALWLAERGWKVTAADLSTVALERGERTAAHRGLTVDWRHLDLTREAAPGSFDLVTASYLHIPADKRAALFSRLTAAVAPGGTLLIVGHHPSDADSGVRRPDLADIGWTAEDLAESLPDGWAVDTCVSRARTEHGPDGGECTVHDAVLRAHRAS